MAGWLDMILGLFVGFVIGIGATVVALIVIADLEEKDKKDDGWKW